MRLAPSHPTHAGWLLAAVLVSCGSSSPESASLAAPAAGAAPTTAVAPPAARAVVPPPPRAEAPGEVAGPSVPAPARQGFVQVSVGVDVSCGLFDDHSVRCWGANTDGRAGLGEVPMALTPTVVAGLPPSRAISVGDAHACALDLEGHVRCWGDNRYGQLGDGTTQGRATPAIVAGLDGVVQIAAGRSHTCARGEGGDVRCWGRALHVGERTRADQTTPIAVHGITDAIDVTLGPEGGCVLRADHTARCWGFNGGVFGARPGPFWTPTWAFRDANDRDIPLRAIALGDRHVCITLEDGHVECAGNDAYGQLMDQWIADDAECDRPTGAAVSQLTCRWQDHPPPREPLPPGAPPPPDHWPPPTPAPLPTHTETFPERRGFVYAHGPVTAVVADGEFGMGRTCILAGDQVACFGRHGRWDWAHRREIAMPLTRGAVQLDVAPHHGCAVIADGRAVCWGDARAGQLGDGTTDAQHEGTFVR